MKEGIALIPKLTANGYSLMIRALNGEGLRFSKIKIGNGDLPDDFSILENLQNPIMEVAIDEIIKMEKYVNLRAIMTNTNFEVGFYWTELGVYVVDPDGGEEDLLYAYAHYQLSEDEAPIYIPAINSNLVEITHNIHVFIGEIENVTAVLAESSEYATRKDLNEHISDTGNPHKVSKAQLGLGNVPNVTPEDQQPVFDEMITPVSTLEDGTKSLANIAKGDRMGVILQKVRSAIAALISHLNGKNPHNIVAADIGAAASAHYHSASDINKGTLGIQRGGTGATTAAGVRDNINVASLDEVPNLYIWKKYVAEPEIQIEQATKKVAISKRYKDSEYYTVHFGKSITVEGLDIVFDHMDDVFSGANDSIIDLLLERYIYVDFDGKSEYYFVPSDAVFIDDGRYLYATANEVNVRKNLGYVASKINDAYPACGIYADGFWYEYHKQLGD